MFNILKTFSLAVSYCSVSDRIFFILNFMSIISFLLLTFPEDYLQIHTSLCIYEIYENIMAFIPKCIKDSVKYCDIHKLVVVYRIQ